MFADRDRPAYFCRMLSKLKSVSKIALAAEAAKFAYDHREEALALLKKLQTWRKSRKVIDVSAEPLPPEERIAQLEKRLDELEALEVRQAELLESLAEDVVRGSKALEVAQRRLRTVSLLAFSTALVLIGVLLSLLLG